LQNDSSQPRPKLALIGEEPRTRGDICDWARTGGGESVHESEGRYDVIDSIEVPMGPLEGAWWTRFAARVWTVIMTSYGTEHYVPLAVGLFPLAIPLFVVARTLSKHVINHIPLFS